MLKVAIEGEFDDDDVEKSDAVEEKIIGLIDHDIWKTKKGESDDDGLIPLVDAAAFRVKYFGRNFG